MKKILENNNAIATLAIIIIAAVVVGAGATTYYYTEDIKSADIDPEDISRDSSTFTPTIKKKDIEEPNVMEQILIYLDITEYRYIGDDLNIKAYTLDGTTVNETIKEYKDKMHKDGYEIIVEETRSGTGWSGTFLFAKSLLHGRAIVAVSGNSVTKLFNCDVLLITSNAPLTTYMKYQDDIFEKLESYGIDR